VRLALKPFWTYYGGKYRIAPSYPEPMFGTIIEPFAGAAGYSLRYADRDIILVDKSEIICGIWRYLIKTTASEVLNLPFCTHTDDVAWPCQEAKWLAGFWLIRGGAHPNKSASAWMRDPRYSKWSWGDHAKNRIASQVDSIRHWRITHGDYRDVPNIEATWFIDPPYHRGGSKYKYGTAGIDFQHLGDWCNRVTGQAIVCEQDGANWLPFRHHRIAKANEGVGRKPCHEVMWTSHPQLLALPC